MHRHPAILEVAVVGVPDDYRGESPKAYVILKEEYAGEVTERDIIDWCKENMATYKRSREVEFRDALPTPVLKTYCAARGFDVCVKAIQIYGGYGYTKDFPAEQLARDVKITSIYEGTDGIQAMDLIGRKLTMNKGAVFKAFIKEMNDAVDRAAAIEGLEPLAGDVKSAIGRLETVTRHILETMGSASFKVAFANSMPFLMVMGDVIMAWMLIWRAGIASEKLQKKSKGRDQAFYQGQIFSAEYFIRSVLPETLGQMDGIIAGGDAVVNISEEAFGG